MSKSTEKENEMVKIITTVMKGLDIRNYVYEARLKGIQGKRKNF